METLGLITIVIILGLSYVAYRFLLKFIDRKFNLNLYTWLLTFILLNIPDVVTTLVMVNRWGWQVEGNPVIQLLGTHFGPLLGLVIYKLLICSFIAFITIRKQESEGMKKVIMFGVAFFSIAVINNLLCIYLIPV